MKEDNFYEKPSEAQLKTIDIIEKNLRVKFKGENKTQATEFISEHMDKSKNTITNAQREVIDMIKANTGRTFQGRSKEDATVFISENMTDSRSAHFKEGKKFWDEHNEWARRHKAYLNQSLYG